MMHKFKLGLAATLLIASLPMLQGCVAALATGAAVGVISAQDRRSTGTQTDDETTEWKAAARVPDRYRNFSHINFTAYNHHLLITGEVPSQEAKSMVESEVRMLDGLRTVHNELGVGPVSALAGRSNDGLVTSKVKARLVDSNQLSAIHIKVVTERGIVYLMGIVNEREAQVAIAIARTTAGVRKVVNLLEVVSAEETRRLDAATPGGVRSVPPATAPVETR